MKIGILHHGGKTRQMITVEVGRYSKRDIKFESAAAALAHVRGFLGLPAPANGNHAALVEAARFARSVLAANPVEMSEQMAIKKLDAALSGESE
jgi:hypothetical protein